MLLPNRCARLCCLTAVPICLGCLTAVPICLSLLASGECLGMAHLSGPWRRRTPGSRQTPCQQGRPRRCRRAQRCQPLPVRRAAIGRRALPRARQGGGRERSARWLSTLPERGGGRASPRARQGGCRERSARWLRTLPERGKGRARLTPSEARGVEAAELCETEPSAGGPSKAKPSEGGPSEGKPSAARRGGRVLRG
ncbi:hypothetical protein T492DRAFT_345883 [Pavlovales sp. CCMP2436]|nr:hypothetical protein T492DRAFT_345883 [Pavlovales sp. CCMP2436]